MTLVHGRAVLSRAGSALALSSDHKPDVESERLRIEANDGKVCSVPRTQYRETVQQKIIRPYPSVDFPLVVRRSPRQVLFILHVVLDYLVSRAHVRG